MNRRDFLVIIAAGALLDGLLHVRPVKGIEEDLIDGDEWSREHFRRRYPRRP